MTSILNQKMIPLPRVSTASISRGMWYVFNDGPNIIRAWGSTWLGLERVYFNDQLIERGDHIKRQEQYSFSIAGNDYRIQCISHNQQTWQVECSLWRDDKKIDGWRCKRKKILNIRPTLAHLYVGIGAGMIGGLFKLPFWYGIFFVFASTILTLITTAKTDDFVFERDPGYEFDQ